MPNQGNMAMGLCRTSVLTAFVRRFQTLLDVETKFSATELDELLTRSCYRSIRSEQAKILSLDFRHVSYKMFYGNGCC